MIRPMSEGQWTHRKPSGEEAGHSEIHGNHITHRNDRYERTGSSDIDGNHISHFNDLYQRSGSSEVDGDRISHFNDRYERTGHSQRVGNYMMHYDDLGNEVGYTVVDPVAEAQALRESMPRPSDNALGSLLLSSWFGSFIGLGLGGMLWITRAARKTLPDVGLPDVHSWPQLGGVMAVTIAVLTPVFMLASRPPCRRNRILTLCLAAVLGLVGLWLVR